MTAKPIMRTIHHLSCSGGTIISKCLASMPGSIVLSEVNPNPVGCYRFNPFDAVQMLLAQIEEINTAELRQKIFLDRINEVNRIISERGEKLIIRDHTHSDYLIQKSVDQITSKTSVITSLSESYDIKSVLTVRNPLNSFLSLKRTDWAPNVQSFDDYCSRVLLMLNFYEALKCPIYKYEDFCDDPTRILKEICAHIEIDYSDDYANKFHTIKMTGDSGRGKLKTKILKLKTRFIGPQLLSAARKSSSYGEICERYAYKFESPWLFKAMNSLSL